MDTVSITDSRNFGVKTRIGEESVPTGKFSAVIIVDDTFIFNFGCNIQFTIICIAVFLHC